MYNYCLLSFSMTVSQSESGYPRPIEHVDIPNTIRKEKGMPAFQRPQSGSRNKPWHKVLILIH